MLVNGENCYGFVAEGCYAGKIQLNLTASPKQSDFHVESFNTYLVDVWSLGIYELGADLLRMATGAPGSGIRGTSFVPSANVRVSEMSPAGCPDAGEGEGEGVSEGEGADTIPPVISLIGASNVTVDVGSIYNDAGATAMDSVDGNITARIIATSTVNTAFPGDYTVTFNVSDTAGNAATPVVRTVHVVPVASDTTPPVITLLGAVSVNVKKDSVYIDAGATAADNVDGNITARIIAVSTVNTAVLGNYTVTYNVSDAAGNAATPVVRAVHVVAPVTPPEGEGEVEVEGEGEDVGPAPEGEGEPVIEGEGEVEGECEGEGEDVGPATEGEGEGEVDGEGEGEGEHIITPPPGSASEGEGEVEGESGTSAKFLGCGAGPVEQGGKSADGLWMALVVAVLAVSRRRSGIKAR